MKAAARAAALGEVFNRHSGRVGLAQELVATGVELASGRSYGLQRGKPSARRRSGGWWTSTTRRLGVKSVEVPDISWYSPPVMQLPFHQKLQR